MPRVPQGLPEREAPLHGINPSADHWVAVGPATIIRGQGTGRPRISGRVVALAVHAEGQRIYAGTALGGVWYSGDAGAHWTSLDFYSSARDAANVLQHADALTVGAIGVVWGATAAADVVYVGPGAHPTLGVDLESTCAAIGVRRATGPVVAVAPVGAAVVGAAAADPWRAETVSLTGVAVNQFAFDLVTADVVWAATSLGLYRRTPEVAAAPGVPAVPPQWTRVNTGLQGEASSVTVVPGAAAGQQVIYVAAVGGGVARSADGAAWNAIALPAFPAAEVVAGTSVGRVRLVRGNVPGSPIVYALADGPRLWRIANDVPSTVFGLPRAISDVDPETLKPFTLGLAVHPAADGAHQDLIAIGGQTYASPPDHRRQAALFTGRVTSVANQLRFPQGAPVAGAPAEWIGGGIPPGVQVLAWVAPAAGSTHLWVGGDGGTFRSIADGTRGTFVERNTGLAAVDVTAFAQAADTDAVMIAGTRSSGLVLRRSAETWEVLRHGRVGGVAIDPGNPRRMYAQQANAVWHTTEDAGATPFTRLAFRTDNPANQRVWNDAFNRESNASAPSSRIGLIVSAHGKRGTQRALGTNRIWYTDDQRLHTAREEARTQNSLRTGWVTLPSLTDPYDGTRAGAPFAAQDALDGAVLAVAWGADDRLYVLTATSVYFFERNVDLTWRAPQHLYDGVAVRNARKAKNVRDQIPHDLPRLSLAVHQARIGTGTLYVGTSGAADRRHVWWHDGAGQWRDTSFAVDTPVHAIAVDPANRHIVYLGTDRGVYQGIGQFPQGVDPTWNWSLVSNGLPGAPCIDLAFHSRDGVAPRLLRAALAGRGVWEMALDNVQQGPEVYLRSHAHDGRRPAVAVGGARDPFGSTRAQVPLDASPDVRIWRAANAPVPEAIDYAIDAQSDEFDIWRLTTGLRAAGEDVDPREGWLGVATQAAIAHRKGILFPQQPPVPTDEQFWDRLLANNPIPHDRTPLDVVDLVSYVREEPDRWPKGFRTSCVGGNGAVTVFVTVHSRHWRPVADNTVSVALLRGQYGRRHSLEGVRALPAGWGASLLQDAGQNQPPGSPNWLQNTGWSHADQNQPFRRITGVFDPQNPQVVPFDVTLTVGDTWHKPGWLLLAVVLVDGDPAPPNQTDVAQLVRMDRRVAARSIRRALLPAWRSDRDAAMDAYAYPGQNTMNTIWSRSNIVWTAMYFGRLRQPAFENPTAQTPNAAPYNAANFTSGEYIVPALPAGAPVLGVYRGHLDQSWVNVWNNLIPDLGALAIYFGHQDPRNVDPEQTANPNPPPAMIQGWRPKGPFDLRVDVALDNADDCAAKGRVSNIPIGAVLYLDWEVNNLNWVLRDPNNNAIVASAEEYCVAFLRELAGFGYRPGVYCRPAASPTLRGRCPGLWIWNVERSNQPQNPFSTPTKNGATQLVVDASNPLMDIGPFTIARQWRLDVTVPQNYIQNLGIDADLSIVHDPSFPERRMRIPQIAGGRAAIAGTGADTCAIYAVRRGRPARASGAIGALVPDQASHLVPDELKIYWNPYSVPAALRAAGVADDPDPEDGMVALGYIEQEGDEVWRLQLLRHRVRPQGEPTAPWIVETLSDAGFVIDPLPGVAAVSRADRSMEVFAVVNENVTFAASGTLAVARRDPETHIWSVLTPVAGITPRRTNRPAAISRNTGFADVFWVDDAGRLITAASGDQHPDQWGAPSPVGDQRVLVHPFSNIAVVARDANRMDVLFLGRIPPPPPNPGAAPAAAVWRLYHAWWTGAAWPANGNTQFADNGTVPIESLSTIGACLRDNTHLDAFFVGRNDGALHVVTFDYTANVSPWSAPVRIGPAPAGFDRLAFVDGACRDGNGAAQVVVTSRDGNLWGTSWDAGAGVYQPLARLPL